MRGDADKLEQILDQSADKRHQVHLSGTIRFHTEYMAGRLYVEVGDTGIGMDEETLERVFRPFERAAQEINSEGFGLGLFITKALVKVLDGSIEVESRPGKGTTFRLSFPLSGKRQKNRENRGASGTICDDTSQTCTGSGR